MWTVAHQASVATVGTHTFHSLCSLTSHYTSWLGGGQLSVVVHFTVHTHNVSVCVCVCSVTLQWQARGRAATKLGAVPRGHLRRGTFSYFPGELHGSLPFAKVKSSRSQVWGHCKRTWLEKQTSINLNIDLKILKNELSLSKCLPNSYWWLYKLINYDQENEYHCILSTYSSVRHAKDLFAVLFLNA